MEPLSELIKRVARPGRLVWIGLRPTRRAEVRSVTEAHIASDGLEGDHARPGKRAVTLMQAEHLSAIGGFLGQGAVPADALRRNLLVDGINLAALKGRQIQIGSARLQITGICAPCSRMEEAFGPGGYSAVRGHGGWCADVVASGLVRVGDMVTVLDEHAEI